MTNPRGIEWIPAGDIFPPPVIEAGVEDGKLLYVIRAKHKGGLIPGKLCFDGAHIGFGYQEFILKPTECEMLAAPPATVSWIEASGTKIPPDTVVGGEDPNGVTLYVGRAIHEGNLVVGNVNKEQGLCYVPYNGKEYTYTTYEVLVRNAFGRVINA